MAEIKKDLVIIGGGPAGLSAAVSAAGEGVKDLLIIERDVRLGGILNQCIHNGFGLHTFKEELTGPEYADRYIKMAEKEQIPYMLDTMVIDLSYDEASGEKIVTAMNKTEGLFTVRARAVILAMGCRERPRGALNIPGFRPSGIYSAGTAQYYTNMEGKLPGKRVVILGSGDIGLIMARRMTFEGAKVLCVAELQPYSGGLKRNIVQCLDDFGIPLLLSHTVVDIKGDRRVEGVTIAEVDENKKPIPGTEKYYECDTLLLSCGLIPENELTGKLGAKMNPVTGGAFVNESLETDIPGVYACGNVLHVHDLVDYVSGEATTAGKNAADHILGKTVSGDDGVIINVKPESGVRYSVPSVIRPAFMPDTLTVRFRVGNEYRDKNLTVSLDGVQLMKLPKRVMAPGEMEQIVLVKSKVYEIISGKDIREHELIIRVEDKE
ncbi:MAG: NAD(P)/FAD-dependent oxidoreductase [Lachnospiraceae bacterium]|nr:NAD(P)/FAD-dependent oxidoreductase [Lachnospiraceae bacterium]